MGVKTNPFLFFSKSAGCHFSIAFNLLWIDHGVACFSPGLHAAGEALNVLISHGDILGCLTGSGRFLVSAAVKDNLLIL
jgi:hypothetical protein